MTSILQKIYDVLDRRQRMEAFLLFVMMLVGGCLEALGVGLIVPFLAVAQQPEVVMAHPLVAPVLALFHVTKPESFVIITAAALLGVYVLKNAYLSYLYFRNYRFVFNNQVIVSCRLFEAYLKSPFTFHLEQNTAGLLRNVASEIWNFFQGAMISAMTLATELLVVAVVLGLLLVLHPLSSIAALVLIGLTGGLFNYAIRRQLKLTGELRQYNYGMMLKWVNEGLGGIKETKVLGCEPFFLGNYAVNSQGLADASRGFAFYSIVPQFLIETVAVAGLLVATILSIAQGKATQSLFALLGLFGMAAIRLMPSVKRIMGAINMLRYYAPSVDIIHTDIHRVREIPSPQAGDPCQQGCEGEIPFERELTIENVSYRYPTSETDNLSGITLRICKGEAVGLVGPSGAGKSTLADVLLGLFPPQKGCIKADGADIYANLPAWRKKIGYIPQTIYLTDDTIRSNVAFGVPRDEIDDSRVFASLSAARLSDFVRGLPEGLDTVVGERGVRISGGQRQRIGIARALYRDPEILLFDEATSSLDTKTEKEITATIEALSGQKTLIVIAHRMSTVRKCNQLFFLAGGKLLDAGTYEDLENRNATFRDMVATA